MGGGRDKRKKAKERKGEVVGGKGDAKTEKKTARNEEKKERRAQKRLEGDEDDIDALLAQFAVSDKAQGEVKIEADCAPPSARVSASFIPYVAPKVNEIIMFGGEVTELESGKVRVYNDLYRYNTDKGRWTRVTSPKSPAPRSAHQAAIVKTAMYVFGGEFTSPNQERFHHFKELWRLDLGSWEWDSLPLKGGPTARSGHRMVAHKGRIILFGGYYDTGREMKYYNDLWELDVSELKWKSLGPLPNAQSGATWPSPRSGFQLALHGDTLFVYGGYSKTRDDEDPELEHGKAMDDMWALDLTKYTWERVKKAGMAPGARSSFSLAVHKGRAFLFGGASDNEAKGGLDLSSEFHNDLYTFNLDKRRWYAAELRPPAKAKGADGKGGEGAEAAGGEGASSSMAAAEAAAAGDAKAPAAPSPQVAALLAAGQDKNSAIYRAAVKIQAQFRGYVVRKAYKLYRLGGVVSEILYSPAAYGLDMSAKNMPRPKARLGAQVCVVGNTLWLFGGTIEIGDKEITLDDMWSLDLQKLDGWDMVKENTVGDDVFKAGAESSSDYETDSGDDE
mmetsp:Transcript_35362/g.89532  ORF Transcript_35362/g.89532 Transcript_35362/m.89532 type:complete len:561 (-) Transcript_35362:2296-3978(-)|eukprot:CAMPEP_0202873184 /NCGR_PEP_ID=MMETSP1391-20130828/22762_1 /ASSEMBLY_ACC=CAM_ASM_000867 /TAXON_ID=1034604 /ORGANISM="Chlamydomonas leiostraca, Strain SAG 11-49" /LENGTH=560 /DNA_ID=CAMNT_0049554365 /DNA_START=23 /DNA_END=1705 /DNA_ORIENTATION=-